MFNILKKVSAFVYTKITNSLKEIKTNIFNSLNKFNEPIVTPAVKEKILPYSLKEKGKYIDFTIILTDKKLSYDVYEDYMSVLKEKLDLSKNLARLRTELICYPKETEKAAMFSLNKSYTIYEDTYSKDILSLYKDIIKLSENYNVNNIITIRLKIDLYPKTYKIK